MFSQKTDVSETSRDESLCPLHKTKHSLNQCIGFRFKPLAIRRQFVKENGICCRCCGQQKYTSKNCTASVTCDVCGEEDHPTALHVSPRNPQSVHGGEEVEASSAITNSCTYVCGDPRGVSKSCAKTVLVRVYPEGEPHKALRVYAIIDDQSNRTLARSKFFDHFNENGNKMDCLLASCSGHTAVTGRIAAGCIVESFDGSSQLKLPTLIECDGIPNVRHEIPTPEAAYCHPHRQSIADLIPP